MVEVGETPTVGVSMSEPVEVTVMLPLALAEVANKIAAEQHWTLPEAVVFLVKRGVKAQQESERTVANNYERYMLSNPLEEEKTGADLMRAIFGPDRA